MKLKGLALMALAVALFGCAPEEAQQAQQMEMSADDMAALEAAFTAVSDAWQEAYVAGDAAGVASLYSDDAMYMLPNELAVQGRMAIEQRLSSMMEQLTSRSIEIAGDITEVSGDLAYGTGMYKMSGEVMGEPLEDEGKYLVVMKKQADGSWKIQAHIWNSNLPLPMEGEMMEGEM
jgi:uncharacterized protein (TIGR02246 family)